MILLYILLTISCLFWVAVITQGLEARRKLQTLADNIQPASTPKISILIPARNESRILPQTLDTLLKIEYPDFEVLVIDDHSDDGTPEIALEYASRDPRVAVIRAGELPECWKGKPWALQHGLVAAKGAWVLLTDADVTHHPQLLKCALAEAQREKVDLLSVLPEAECKSFWEKVMIPSFAIILGMVRPPHKSNDPKSRVALAAGGFILTKTLIIKHLGGYDAIRDSIIEDVKLAELYKESGYRIKTVLCPSHWLRTRMYDSLAGIWEGLSRHASEGGGGHNPWKLLAAVLAGLGLNVLPCFTFAAGLIGSHYLLMGLSTFPLLSMAAVQTGANRLWRISPLYFFSFPLASFIYSLIMLHSAWSYHFGSGNLWKGRRYAKPEKEITAEPAENVEKV